MTMHLSDIEWLRLTRYLAGESDIIEATAVERWINADADRAADVDCLRQAMALRGVRVDLTDVDGARQRFEARLQEHVRRTRCAIEEGKTFRIAHQNGEADSGITRRLGTRTLRGGIWLTVSITALLVALLVFRLGSPPTTGASRSYATKANQSGIVTLDDGTRVTLAPQTTLRLVGFSKDNRTVSVDGKAYFEVTHAAGAPFEVRSGSVTTRVLGTAFLIDHAPNTSRVRVAVEEGKVQMFSVSRTNANLMVSAGYVGEITDTTTKVDAVVDSPSGTEWLRGKLAFYHLPVATVLQTLTRWYGYQFRCVDSTLPQRNVNIALSMRSSAVALATLEHVLSVNLTITGDTVTLTPQQAERGPSRLRNYDVWTPSREVGR